MSTQRTSSEKKLPSSVTSLVGPDGTLEGIVLGRVRLLIYGKTDKEPLILTTEDNSIGISIEDPDKEPGRRYKLRAYFGLESDNTFAGFYIDEQTEIQHFRGPAKGQSQAAAIAAGRPWRPAIAPPPKKKGKGKQPTKNAVSVKTKRRTKKVA